MPLPLIESIAFFPASVLDPICVYGLVMKCPTIEVAGLVTSVIPWLLVVMVADVPPIIRVANPSDVL